MIGNILQFALQENICETKQPLAAYSLLDVCFQLIEKGGKLNDLSLDSFLNYCKMKGDQLTYLNLKDRGIQNLQDILSRRFNLRELDLTGTNIASLEVLKDLSKLEKLNLWGCENLSSEEFLKIKEICPNLKELDLTHTAIASLEGLRGLLQLEKLKLYGCENLSKEAVTIFKENFPNPSLKLI